MNTANGAQGTRRRNLIEWLQVQSQRGVNIVTICEANTWESLESKSSLDKNRKVIEQIAAEGGFAHSFVTDFSQFSSDETDNSFEQTVNEPHPYNIGIITSLSFTVMSVHGPPIFERGLVHVYFSDLDLDLIVVHLHAHNSKSREQETQVIATMVTELIALGKRVAVTGDFNTLNPLDKGKYEEEGLLNFYKRQDYPIFKHMREKYCTNDSLLSSLASLSSQSDVSPGKIINYKAFSMSKSSMSNESVASKERSLLQPVNENINILPEILSKPTLASPSQTTSHPLPPFRTMENLDFLELNYKPLQILLDTGLHDICHSSCKHTISSEYTKCISIRCQATQPTALDFEWPKMRSGDKQMDVRLDYILVSQALLDDAKTSIRSEVQRNEMTGILSDHFPVQASWKWAKKGARK